MRAGGRESCHKGGVGRFFGQFASQVGGALRPDMFDVGGKPSGHKAPPTLNAALSPALLPGASPGDSTRGLHSPVDAGLAGLRPNSTGETPQQAAENISAFKKFIRPAMIQLDALLLSA